MTGNERTGPRHKGTGPGTQVATEVESIVPEGAPGVLPPDSGLDLAARYREMEHAYVSALLHIGSEAVAQAVPNEALADPACRQIHATAAGLLRSRKDVDPLTVTLTLAGAPGDWQRTVPSLYTMQGVVPSHWLTYAAAVREGAWLRSVQRVQLRLRQALEAGRVAAVSEALAEAGRLARGNGR